jgi:hypothetical protein
LIARKTFIVAVAAFISGTVLLASSFAFYSILTGGYHNDTVNTLYTISGKCTNIVNQTNKGIGRNTSTPHFILTIGGERYFLDVYDTSYTSAEERTEFEKKVLAADSITIQYVVSIDDEAVVQALEIPGDMQYVALEDVMKRNYQNSNLMFGLLMTFYLAVQSLTVILTRFQLKELPSVKTAIRRAKRKNERVEQTRRTNTK